MNELQPIIQNSQLPVVLLATVDPEIRSSIVELLETFPIQIRQVRAVDEVRMAIARENVLACFCGFWLTDGTYREVVRYLRRQPREIPAIIVCAPACPHEYGDYLAALNIRAFDFICHPYKRTYLERILDSAISVLARPEEAVPATLAHTLHTAA
jgi:DNA-binding NtrC family response regulator